MRSFTKKASASSSPRLPTRAPHLDRAYGLPSRQTPSLLLCPPNNPVRLTSLLINIAVLCHFRHTTTQKKRLASGGFAPDQVLCSWTPLGAQPPDTRYRLELCARHMPIWPPISIPGSAPALSRFRRVTLVPMPHPPRHLDSRTFCASTSCPLSWKPGAPQLFRAGYGPE